MQGENVMHEVCNQNVTHKVCMESRSTQRCTKRAKEPSGVQGGQMRHKVDQGSQSGIQQANRADIGAKLRAYSILLYTTTTK